MVKYNIPLLFLQTQGCLVDLFSSFTGWPWLGRKASRFLLVAWTTWLPVWPPCTTIVLVVELVGHEVPFTVTEHPVVEPVGDWYSWSNTPVVGTTLPVEFGDEKLLIVNVGAFPVTKDSWGEKVFWCKPPVSMKRYDINREMIFGYNSKIIVNTLNSETGWLKNEILLD